MIRTIAPWLLWLMVIALLAIAGRKGVRGVTSNPRSLTETPVTRVQARADREKPDCRGTSLAEEVRP